MASGINRLPASYKNLKPGLHCDGGNLYLQVSIGAAGNRRESWIFRYMLKGQKARDMGLGSANDISLSEARETARENRKLVKQGIDPIDRRNAEVPCRAATKELVLHMAVAKVLRPCAVGVAMVPYSERELRDKRTAGKLKQVGIKAGWPDFVLIPPTGQLHCLELKRLGETLSDAQEAFQLWTIRHAVPHCVAYSIDEALAALDHWGVLRIRIGGAR